LIGPRIGHYSNDSVTGIIEPDMLAGMAELEFLQTFDVTQSGRIVSQRVVFELLESRLPW